MGGYGAGRILIIKIPLANVHQMCYNQYITEIGGDEYDIRNAEHRMEYQSPHRFAAVTVGACLPAGVRPGTVCTVR